MNEWIDGKKRRKNKLNLKLNENTKNSKELN